MKRTALKRKTPLRRKKSPTKRAPRRVGNEGSDPAYLARVRELPCCVSEVCLPTPTPCSGPIEAHHPRQYARGLATKAYDVFSMSLCHGHHRDLHACAGWFRELSRNEKRHWQAACVEVTQRKLTGAVLDPTRAGTGKEGK